MNTQLATAQHGVEASLLSFNRLWLSVTPVNNLWCDQGISAQTDLIVHVLCCLCCSCC
jgi:hypothetical protein